MIDEEKEATAHFGTVHFEKRKTPRFSLDLPVEYWPINSSKNYPARTGNISEGGVLVYLPEQIEIGRKLRLRLFIDSGVDFISIEAVVQVAWSDLHTGKDGDYRTGVKFVDISEQDMRNLQNFLNSLIELKNSPKSDIPPRLLSALGIKPLGNRTLLNPKVPDQK